MYTLEQQQKAVELLVSTSHNDSLVIQTLGYPSPNALRQWWREYEESGTLHIKSLSKPRFSERQKRETVEYYLHHGQSLIGTCRALGYPNRGTLALWLKEQFPNGIPRKENSCRCGRTYVRLSQEQKLEAIQRVIVCHEPEYRVASEYGVSKASISKRKRQFLGKDAMPMKKRQVPVDTTDLPDFAEALHAEIKSLKEEIEALRMERDTLEMAAKLLKKAEGIDLKSLQNKEKADVIDALRKYYQLKNLLSLLGFPKSSYFYLKSASRLPDKHKNTKEKVKTIFHGNYNCFGYRRLHLLLKRQGITVSEKIVRRIMHEESLRVCRKRQHKYSSYLGEISPAVSNLLKRDFHADRPNQKWLTDLREFALPAGKVYLSPVIDCFDGMVVHWTIGPSPNA